MEVYPYNSPIIMTDGIYLEYGGPTGTSTLAQRTAAYLIAEIQMTSHLKTFLLPTIVTGTFPWPHQPHLVLPNAYVSSIKSVKVLHQESYCNCDLVEYSGCAFIWNDTYGYIDVRALESASCACCDCASGPPYQVQVVWEAGLPTGTANQAPVLLGLKIAAEINLNEIVDPNANEAVGDMGVQEFSNQFYKEVRVKMGRSAFGTSARANKIANLVAMYQKKRALRL